MCIAGAHLSVLPIKMATLPPIGNFAAMSAAWLDDRSSDIEELGTAVKELRKILNCHGISSDVVGRYCGVSAARAGCRRACAVCRSHLDRVELENR